MAETPHPQGEPRRDRSSAAEQDAAARRVDLGVIPEPRRVNWSLILILIALVALVGGFGVYLATAPPLETADAPPPAAEQPMLEVISPLPVEDPAPEPDPVPAGFSDTGAGLAIQYVDRECSASDAGCAHMEVYALQDCRNSAHVGLNVLDAGGNVIGSMSDTVASLRAGQTAIMEFLHFEKAAATVEVVDVSCR